MPWISWLLEIKDLFSSFLKQKCLVKKLVASIVCQTYWIYDSLFQIGDRENTYDQFLDDLLVKDGDADDCRYAIYDYEYVVNSQGTEPSNRYVLYLYFE